MDDNSIQGLMQTAMTNIREMVDVNTIIGDAVTTPDGTVIIPISKVTFGFVAGGGKGECEVKEPKNGFGGGSGGGSHATTPGNGGNGSIPGGGGGGGGASTNGATSGAGGSGARGEIRIYRYG